MTAQTQLQIACSAWGRRCAALRCPRAPATIRRGPRPLALCRRPPRRRPLGPCCSPRRPSHLSSVVHIGPHVLLSPLQTAAQVYADENTAAGAHGGLHKAAAGGFGAQDAKRGKTTLPSTRPALGDIRYTHRQTGR